jgi:hypothetical protein
LTPVWATPGLGGLLAVALHGFDRGFDAQL